MAGELKKKLLECLLELPKKKEELEQLQQLCHNEHLSKQELLAQNESLKVEVNNLRAQLDFINKVLHKCEENFQGAKDALVRHKLGLEASSRIGDKMKEEAIRVHSENMALKKQIEQQEKETKTETFYRESCMSKQSKMQAAIDSLINQMRGLEKDFRDVEKKSNSSISLGSKNKLALENKNHIIKELREKLECLKDQNTSLSSEIETLKLNENKSLKPVEQDYIQDIMKEWQISMNEMKERTKKYKKDSETMYNTLEMALKDMKKYQEFEEKAKGKVRELEAQLEAAKWKGKKMSTDCSVQTDLAMCIEVGCQTSAAELEDSGAVQAKEPVEPNISKDSYSKTALTPNLKYSSSSVSELISQFHKERMNHNSEETYSQGSQVLDETRLSQMTTQPNMKLNYHINS